MNTARCTIHPGPGLSSDLVVAHQLFSWMTHPVCGADGFDCALVADIDTAGRLRIEDRSIWRFGKFVLTPQPRSPGGPLVSLDSWSRLQRTYLLFSCRCARLSLNNGPSPRTRYLCAQTLHKRSDVACCMISHLQASHGTDFDC